MNKAYLIPKKPLTITSTSRAHSFPVGQLDHAAIIAKLKVTTNPRYKAEAGLTYCNIAAHDFATLYGVYIPRVWWTTPAMLAKDWRVIYGTTVKEVNANGLQDWMLKYGSQFGWRQSNIAEAQEHVNNGGFATIIADRRDRFQSGHITIIVPGEVKNGAPYQWQAGATNYDGYHSKWYQGDKFKQWGVYINER